MLASWNKTLIIEIVMMLSIKEKPEAIEAAENFELMVRKCEMEQDIFKEIE